MSFIPTAYAHEQYVLTKQQLQIGFADKNTSVLTALHSPENLKIAFLVGLGITATLVIYFFFQYSKLGILFNKLISKLDPFGHFFLRIALGLSLIASAHFSAFLGPEIPASSLAFSSLFLNILNPLLFILGLLLILGLFTRITALIFGLLLIFALLSYGDYMLTYFNYYGEALALIIFGTYFLSMDQRIREIPGFVNKYRDLELFLIRATYGISVLYPAITIKLLHPAIIVMIVNEYHLNQIHWLFPQDPLLISLGTGLAQILVGTMIIVGFETRLASLATFLLYILSVIYFKEAVWPHVVLLSLALYLVINSGGNLAIDTLIGRKLKKLKKG